MGNVTGFVTGVCYTRGVIKIWKGLGRPVRPGPSAAKSDERARGLPERGGCMAKLQYAPESFLTPAANPFGDAVDRVSA